VVNIGAEGWMLQINATETNHPPGDYALWVEFRQVGSGQEEEVSMTLKIKHNEVL
jgi:hypothetical protein